MTRWDWNKDEDAARSAEWQPGDEVWIDHTLYVLMDEKDENGNLCLQRHDPIILRGHGWA